MSLFLMGNIHWSYLVLLPSMIHWDQLSKVLSSMPDQMELWTSECLVETILKMQELLLREQEFWHKKMRTMNMLLCMLIPLRRKLELMKKIKLEISKPSRKSWKNLESLPDANQLTSIWSPMAWNNVKEMLSSLVMESMIKKQFWLLM